MGAMFHRTFFSIQTLKQYVNERNIVVFFTPPRDEEQIEWLRGLGVDVRLVENSTQAFEAFDKEQHYGEKTWISTIDDDVAVFLDCDTVVLGDIRETISGDFQFKARPGTSQVRQPGWRKLFGRFDESYMDWMPNAGFLIFKDGIHKDIGDSWREYVQVDLEYQLGVNHKEQYALALVVGSYKKEKMSDLEHVMMWNSEFPPDGVVYHIGKSIRNQFDIASTTFKGSMYNGLRMLLRGNI